MITLELPVRHGGQRYEKIEHEWYVEPAWCVDALIATEQFEGLIWDPACGCGTIPEAFKRAGYDAVGSDIADRGYGRAYIDFLRMDAHDINYCTIVTNPPFKRAQQFIEHAIVNGARKVATLVPITFLAAQRRHALFTINPPKAVYVLSRRPSMPPGGRDIEAKGGKTDYCWIVFESDFQGPTRLAWLNPNIGGC